MPDLKQISLPYEVRECAERMVETFHFQESIDAVKFCVAYAIKNFPADITNVKMDENQPRGLDYSTSSFNEIELSAVIDALFPEEAEEKFRFIKKAAILGARKIKEKLDGDNRIDDICGLM